jgi:hypothetical protein
MIKRSTVNYMGSDGHNIIKNKYIEKDKNSFAATMRKQITVLEAPTQGAYKELHRYSKRIKIVYGSRHRISMIDCLIQHPVVS